MWDLYPKEWWALKNWCFQTVVLEKILESPLNSKEIKPGNPKGNQPWVFTGRTNAEAETPVVWPPDAKSWLIRKNLDAGKYWGQEDKGATEHEMVGWHHWINGSESEQTPGDTEGQESLACCSLWRPKEAVITEGLDNNKKGWRKRKNSKTVKQRLLKTSGWSSHSKGVETLLHQVTYPAIYPMGFQNSCRPKPATHLPFLSLLHEYSLWFDCLFQHYVYNEWGLKIWLLVYWSQDQQDLSLELNGSQFLDLEHYITTGVGM